jgi:hypothetical protein
VLALVAVSVGYRQLVLKGLQHTSLVFIGLPALTALVLLQARPRTAIGTINKVIAIALCMSGILFGEGLVCILFAAPIFFLVGTLVGAMVNAWRGRRESEDPSSARWRAAVALLVMPFAVEGVVPTFERPRDERVTVTRVVVGAPEAVRASLAMPPRFDVPLPPFFRLGFPVPVHASGTGLQHGDRRSVIFSHGRHHHGALVLRVAGGDSASVRFTPVSDESYITHWLAWEGAEVRWAPEGGDHTRVTWTLRYRRRLDPAWYFAPLERYGVILAAGYLIETLATPRSPTTQASLASW